MSEQSAPLDPPPQARLAQMATGFILSRLVYTAASLGIATIWQVVPSPPRIWPLPRSATPSRLRGSCGRSQTSASWH